MIASLRGVLEYKDAGSAVIEVNGVGYQCLMSVNSLQSLGAVGSIVRVETLLIVRNDAISLYGFASAEERTLFESLTSVSGVGAKFALAILSAYAPPELTEIIQASDALRLTAVPGIGKKTAQRIILELQGSLELIPGSLDVENLQTDSAHAEVISALQSMGFSSSEIALALTTEEADFDAAALEASELMRQALKRLG